MRIIAHTLRIYAQQGKSEGVAEDVWKKNLRRRNRVGRGAWATP